MAITLKVARSRLTSPKSFRDGPSDRLSSEYTNPSHGRHASAMATSVYSCISRAESCRDEPPLIRPLSAGWLSMKKKYYDSLWHDGRHSMAYDLYCHLQSCGRDLDNGSKYVGLMCCPPLSLLVASMRVHMCAGGCVLGRAGPVAGARACRHRSA